MAVFTSQSMKRNNPASMEAKVADRNYYIDAEGNLVDEGAENAAFLVAAKGSEVPQDVAEKYGIEIGEAPQEPAPEPAEKKAAAPAANKSVAPAANKKGAKK